MKTTTLSSKSAPRAWRPAMVMVLLFMLMNVCHFQAMAQLHGTYTIDPAQSASASNYKDFASATADLDSGIRHDGGTANGKGVSGAVVFKVADGVYSERVHIGTIPGTSSSKTVTFESASGDNTKVKMSSPSTAADKVNGSFVNYEVWLENVDFVNFQNLTLERTGKDAYADIYFIDKSSNLILDHCNLHGVYMWTKMILCYSTGGYHYHNFYFTNNSIISGYNALRMQIDITDDNIHFENNKMDSIESDFIMFSDGTDVFFKGNSFKQVKFGHSEIQVSSLGYFEVTGNIFNSVYISFAEDRNSTSKTSLIANNIFIGGGLTDKGTSGHNYFYNSFYSVSIGLALKDNLNFLNNLIVDTVSTANPSLSGNNLKMDYNDFYFNKKTYFLTSAGSSYTDFGAWQATGSDKNSELYNPVLSSDKITPNNRKLNFGVPIAIVSTDIYGNPRNPSNPTVGAIELIHMNDITLCKGTCEKFGTPLKGYKYLWSTGDTTDSITYCKTASAKVGVRIQTGPNASDTVSYSFMAYVTKSHCIWPGDANDDNTVSMKDVLAVGQAYGDTGTKRPLATLKWVSQNCDDWSNSFKSGVNHKYADCNGDGKIDSIDFLAISLNFGKTHAKTTTSASGNPNDPPLSIKFNKDSAKAGDTVVAVISLGSSSIKANNMYGLAMSVHYESGGVTPKKIVSNFSNSWLGTIGKDMASLTVVDSSQSTVYLGVTRIDHKNVSGYGQIGTLSIMMPDNIAGKREVKQLFNIVLADYLALNNAETDIPLNPSGDSIVVYQYKTGAGIGTATAHSFISIYPNPAQDKLQVSAKDADIQELTVTDITGRIMYSVSALKTMQVNIPAGHLANGIYILNIKTDKGLAQSRFIKN